MSKIDYRHTNSTQESLGLCGHLVSASSMHEALGIHSVLR